MTLPLHEENTPKEFSTFGWIRNLFFSLFIVAFIVGWIYLLIELIKWLF